MDIQRLHTYFYSLVYPDIGRRLAEQPESVQAAFAESMALTKRLLDQQRHDKKKLYALHAPEVECIAKGNAHNRYEFGVKASIATTNRSNLVQARNQCRVIHTMVTHSIAHWYRSSN